MRAICNAQKVLNSPATAGGLDATIKALTDLQAKLKAAGYQAPDELASDSASSEEDELSAPARIRSSRRRDLEPEESGTDDDESDADARSASRSLSGGRRRRNLARTVVENEMRRVAAKLERGYTFWDALRGTNADSPPTSCVLTLFFKSSHRTDLG